MRYTFYSGVGWLSTFRSEKGLELYRRTSWSTSPVKLQRDLHATLAVRLGAPEAPVVVLQRRAAAQGAKLGPVQEVERLPPEVQALLFPLEINAAGQRQVLVETRPTAQL